MVKLLLVIAVIAAALLTGVVEVKFHFDKLVSAPGTLTRMAVNGNLLEQGRSLVVNVKRYTELYSAQDPAQKMEVMLGFVRQDATRLDELVQKGASSEKIVPQAKLLAKSVEQAREQAWKLSEGEREELEGISQEAFDEASKALATIQGLQQEAEENSRQLADIAEDISQKEGEVAGSEDKVEEKSVTPSPSAIPLQF
ncbi:MAG: hypothetical protein HYR90_01375 [Candidatus Andersenbacteria bacterium]|nr:hypothetical protein [Candidatus Andersenbacteria bacterium]MBI3250517.1 hypothetical protein [Candidatus Andersenbacteria bacterium]